MITQQEEDRFWIKLREGIFDSSRWKIAEREVDAIVRMVGLSRGHHVLDVPCGPGRHLVHLAERGFAVTGVDNTAEYLEQAKQRLHGLAADLVCEDMRVFVRAQAFDLALNLYTSFGYFEDPRDDAQFVDNVHASLRPGGRFVLQLLTRETANVSPPRATERIDESGARLQEWSRLAADGHAIERHFVIDRDGERLEFVAEHRLYGVRDLILLLERAGFLRVAVCGDLDGRPLSSASDHAVFVATR